ncbi:MAG: hypothetical protein QOE36_3596, partial [Gaiellaceae bacterium]|nr:hypothetical protein [Gaiellaceae bacterium]
MWGSDHSRWLRRALALGVATVFAALGVQAVAGSNVAGRAFTLRGNVDRVIDGDTVVVALESGKTTRVRLIGIDTPERGRCY